MKIVRNLLIGLILAVVFFTVVAIAYTYHHDWYRKGHVDPANSCVFIVNDSLKIIAEPPSSLGYIKYHLYISGIELDYAYTYHTVHENLKELIQRIQYKYEKGLEQEEEPNPDNVCFIY